MLCVMSMVITIDVNIDLGMHNKKDVVSQHKRLCMVL
jgi:hypothetical protein